MAIKPAHVFGIAGLGVAGIFAWLATKSAGPVPLPAFTECREGPLEQHLVTKEQLVNGHVYTPHHYPDQVARGVSVLVTHGFAPLWQPNDPQVADISEKPKGVM